MSKKLTTISGNMYNPWKFQLIQGLYIFPKIFRDYTYSLIIHIVTALPRPAIIKILLNCQERRYRHNEVKWIRPGSYSMPE